MDKFKNFMANVDEVQIISKDDLKNISGGGYGFLYRGGAPCRFCYCDDYDK